MAQRTLPPERISEPDDKRKAQYRGPYPVFAFCKSNYHAGGWAGGARAMLVLVMSLGPYLAPAPVPGLALFLRFP